MPENSNILQSKLVKLAIAVSGIYGSFIYYGILQERLFKTDYTGTGEKFRFSWAIIFLQAVMSYIVAKIVNVCYYKLKSSVFPVKLQMQIAFFYSLSMFGSNSALKYISYPIQALMKSSKILSVMFISAFAGTEKFSKIQYVSASLITCGIVIFNLLESGKKSGKGKETTIIGLALILISLLSDGMTGSKQSEARKKFKPSSFDMMEASNKFACLMALIYAIFSMEILPTLNYIATYPACFSDLIVLGLMGTVGQCFIFYTITNFSPFYLSVVTTTRKFFTVIASIFMFGHDVSVFQWASIGLVFFGVGMEIYEGKKKADRAHKEKAMKSDGDKEAQLSASSKSTTYEENTPSTTEELKRLVEEA